jgi:uncharacterized protein (TIGR03435 family)
MATMVDFIETDKVIGGPSWLDTDQFDLVAKAPADATPELLRLMPLALLEDRFKLVVHHDTRPFPRYALTAGKHPQLKEAMGGGESGCQSLAQNAQNVSVSCHNMTMSEFVNRLPRISRQLFPGDHCRGYDWTERFLGFHHQMHRTGIAHGGRRR